jgi:hypothetical protein
MADIKIKKEFTIKHTRWIQQHQVAESNSSKPPFLG